MSAPLGYLQSFHSLNVGQSIPQRDGLRWLISALQRTGKSDEKTGAALSLYEQFLSSDHVVSRTTCVTDYTHLDWDRMDLFRETLSPPLENRMKVFREVATRAAEEAFPPSPSAPDFLLQVSCTGYDSPTAAQRILARREWKATKTLHLGHMGCYAGMPAAFTAAELLRASRGKFASLFLIELCTLHLHPQGNDLQQVVMNTLFADGAIRFDISSEPVPQSFALLKYDEGILPDSEKEMTWTLKDSAFAMTLSRAVPVLIARNLSAFLDRFLSAEGLRQEDISYFAIHPGGPKIIELIAEKLNLIPEQFRHSREVFRARGNMSSCTVPHIWKSMLDDTQVRPGSLIVSFGFGPGLTISANLLRKC